MPAARRNARLTFLFLYPGNQVNLTLENNLRLSLGYR